jgi:ribosomal protein L40E
MVTPDGRVKLIDFGIARTYKVGQRRDTITMGSENYAAPEQWGKAQTDPRADIYSLGATMYHLLTRVPPLPAFVPTPRLPVQQYNPAVSDRTAAVVDRAMSQDRDKRYPTARAMRDALLECLPKVERERLEVRLRWPAPVAQHVQDRGRQSAPQPVAQAQSRAGQRSAAQAQRSPTPAAPMRHIAYGGGAAAASRVTMYTKPCPRCSALNQPSARFCRHCGQAYVAPLPPVLAVVQPPGARWEYPLHGTSILIGRQGGGLAVDLDIGFYDPGGYISRNHARVTLAQRRYQITDLGSSNGTYVNGEALTPNIPRLLANGDHIRLGRVVLQFRMR